MKLKSYTAVIIILLGLSGASFVAMYVLQSPFLEHIGIALLIFIVIVAITWALRKLNKPDAKPED
ncbi:MAG: hypothetical protein KGI28_03095 [Thaumarchaeota archaeon]|nr:hypothetical protein [Nitrososphaerota archaeon]